MREAGFRNRLVCRYIGLVFYLSGGWRTYKNIANEFGWGPKTSWRSIRALEDAGLPIAWELSSDDISGRTVQHVRLPSDWVARTPWLRRYVVVKDPVPLSRKEFA